MARMQKPGGLNLLLASQPSRVTLRRESTRNRNDPAHGSAVSAFAISPAGNARPSRGREPADEECHTERAERCHGH